MPTIHTMPANDTIEHTADRACPCEPVTEEVVADDGYVGYSVAHNAADGRD